MTATLDRADANRADPDDAASPAGCDVDIVIPVFNEQEVLRTASAACTPSSPPASRSAGGSPLPTTPAPDYTWIAAAIGSQSASGYQLATQQAVMPVGGFNGSDPSPTL